MKNEDTLGGRLRSIRNATGLNQGDFAQVLGVTRGAPSISAWERDANEPGIDVLNKVCSEFSVTHEWLLTGAGSVYSNETAIHKNTTEPRDVFQFDEGLLQSIIVAIEDFLSSERKKLPSDKKAQLINMLYKMFIKDGQVDRERVFDLVRLVA